MEANNLKDPKCPHCQRPVIGLGIAGQEGTYHLECTQSPYKYKDLIEPPEIQPFRPWKDNPYGHGPTWRIDTNKTSHDNKDYQMTILFHAIYHSNNKNHI